MQYDVIQCTSGTISFEFQIYTICSYERETTHLQSKKNLKSASKERAISLNVYDLPLLITYVCIYNAECVWQVRTL